MASKSRLAEPNRPYSGVYRRAGNDGHQFLHGCVRGVAHGARGTVDLAQGGRELLQKKDGAFGCCRRVVSGDRKNFGESFMDALDRKP
jgi:hypothetical protein